METEGTPEAMPQFCELALPPTTKYKRNGHEMLGYLAAFAC